MEAGQYYVQFTPPDRHDKTVLSVSCQAVLIESRDGLAKSEQLARRVAFGEEVYI